MTFFTFLRDNLRWLGAGILLTFLSSFGQTFFISLFAGEIRAEFGLSHGDWGGLYAMGTMVSAIVMVWAGGLTDIFRIRTLAPIVFGILGIACLFMAFNTSVWALPIIIFVLRLTGQGMSTHLAMVAMARWFVSTRGRALSISRLGFSFGEAVLPFMMVSAMAVLAWQNLWIVMAAVAFLGAPLILWLLGQERTPQSHAKSDQALGMQGRHWSRKEALTHPLFWAIVPTVAGLSAFGTAFFFHQVHFTEIKEWSHISFVAQIPIYTGVSVVAMLAAGWAVDRFGAGVLLPFVLLPFSLGLVIFAFAWSPMIGVIGFICMGAAGGAFGTIIAAFWAEYYGTKYIGGIKSLGSAVMVFGSAVGPWLTGIGIDLGFGFDRQLLAIAAYFVFTSLILFWALRAARR